MLPCACNGTDTDAVVGSKPKVAPPIFEHGIHMVVDETLPVARLMLHGLIVCPQEIAHRYALRVLPNPYISVAIAQHIVDVIRHQARIGTAFRTQQLPCCGAVSPCRIDTFAVYAEQQRLFVIARYASAGLIGQGFETQCSNASPFPAVIKQHTLMLCAGPEQPRLPVQKDSLHVDAAENPPSATLSCLGQTVQSLVRGHVDEGRIKGNIGGFCMMYAADMLPTGTDFIDSFRRTSVSLLPVHGQTVEIDGPPQPLSQVGQQAKTVSIRVETEDFPGIGIGRHAAFCRFTEPDLMAHVVFNHPGSEQSVVAYARSIVAIDTRFGGYPHASPAITAQRKHSVAAQSAVGRELIAAEHVAPERGSGPRNE